MLWQFQVDSQGLSHTYADPCAHSPWDSFPSRLPRGMEQSSLSYPEVLVGFHLKYSSAYMSKWPFFLERINQMCPSKVLAQISTDMLEVINYWAFRLHYEFRTRAGWWSGLGETVRNSGEGVNSRFLDIFMGHKATAPVPLKFTSFIWPLLDSNVLPTKYTASSL